MKQLLFVDDEVRVLQGLQRQLHGQRHEWTMDFVESAGAALDFMARHPVDVVITDMMMPGMDGAQLLAEVRELHPQTIRLVLSGHTDRESALKLVGPAHQYLSKPCDAAELREAVARSFTLRDVLSNERLKQLATHLAALPVLPTLSVELTAELRRENPSIDHVSDIIGRDIGMTTKILQLVNSAFFGLPQPFVQVNEAVVYLGLATVRSLTLSLQIFSQYEKVTIPGFSLELLARHGWEVATLARRIAQAEHAGVAVAEQCFLSGMLHDVGYLILAASLPAQVKAVMERAQREHISVWESELLEFGATHAEVGGYLLSLWGLPVPVVEAVCLHHRPADSAHAGFSPVIAIHAADHLAHQSGATAEGQPASRLDLVCLARLGLAARFEVWKQRCADGM